MLRTCKVEWVQLIWPFIEAINSVIKKKTKPPVEEKKKEDIKITLQILEMNAKENL